MVVATISPGRDLGMLGVFIHVLGDAINNIGVIIAAAIIWKVESDNRYYADPAVGVFIAIMILLSAIPLVKNSGTILLQIAPDGINPEDVKHDIEKVILCTPRVVMLLTDDNFSDPRRRISSRVACLASRPAQVDRVCPHSG